MSNFIPNLRGVCGYKLVHYFGTGLNIPDNIDFLAVDESGDLFGFVTAPEFVCDAPEIYGCVWSNQSGLANYLGNIKYAGDWKQSLRRV